LPNWSVSDIYTKNRMDGNLKEPALIGMDELAGIYV
jgi:hypothetical protein